MGCIVRYARGDSEWKVLVVAILLYGVLLIIEMIATTLKLHGPHGTFSVARGTSHNDGNSARGIYAMKGDGVGNYNLWLSPKYLGTWCGERD